MARQLRNEHPGAVYHVTSRGNRREPIFQDAVDTTAFLTGLARVVRDCAWLCHAYCLMENHFHLVVETPRPNLAIGMRRLNSTYAQRFNSRHSRVGARLPGSLPRDPRRKGVVPPRGLPLRRPQPRSRWALRGSGGLGEQQLPSDRWAGAGVFLPHNGLAPGSARRHPQTGPQALRRLRRRRAGAPALAGPPGTDLPRQREVRACRIGPERADCRSSTAPVAARETAAGRDLRPSRPTGDRSRLPRGGLPPQGDRRAPGTSRLDGESPSTGASGVTNPWGRILRPRTTGGMR